MILFLVHLFEGLGWKVPHVFSYVSFRMVVAAMSSMSLTVLLGKAFIAQLSLLKIGHRVRIGDIPALAAGYTKSESVPSMGGILFISTIFFSSILWLDLTHFFSLFLLFTMLWMGLIGMIDDSLKLRKKGGGIAPRMKMICQCLLGLFLCLYLFLPNLSKQLPIKPPRVKECTTEQVVVMKEMSLKEYALHYYIPFIKRPIVLTKLGIFGILCAFGFSLFVISGSANSVNLTDGLDGLASGLVLLAAVVLAILAFLSNHIGLARYLNILYIDGASEIAVFLSTVSGALLGFLWYNSYPAEVFMGDTGSLSLGGILGVSAILLRREFLLALIGAVFVIETLSVIIQILSCRYRKGKRVFLCSPIHHHFQMKGWHESKVVIRFWIIGLLFALLGIASVKFQ